VQYPPDSLIPQILRNERLRAARLLIGGATYVAYDTTLLFVSVPRGGEAVNPNPTYAPTPSLRLDALSVQPNVVSVHGGEFKATLTIDPKTKMPAQLQFPDFSAQMTMTFEDRRDIGGVRMPFHIKTTSGGHVVDELMFDEIIVNPELDNGSFKR
jgi:hypothetical protein